MAKGQRHKVETVRNLAQMTSRGTRGKSDRTSKQGSSGAGTDTSQTRYTTKHDERAQLNGMLWCEVLTTEGYKHCRIEGCRNPMHYRPHRSKKRRRHSQPREIHRRHKRETT